MNDTCISYNIYHIFIVLFLISCIGFILILTLEPTHLPMINITQSPSLNNLTTYSYDNNSLNFMHWSGKTYGIGNIGDLNV